MAEAVDYRLGEFEFPRGWFMILDATELEAAPVSLRYFGRDMVLYRGKSGKPHLVHAYCPHMGAHLGKNSTSHIVRDNEHIQGESIRCPFHGWRFGPDGQCDDIPYSPNFIPKSACLKTYTVVERAGIIWMWNDPEDKEPDYDLPAFAEWDKGAEGWVRWTVDDYGELGIHPIEILDNMADCGHMIPIHGSSNILYFDNLFKDHVLVQRFDAGHRLMTDDESSVFSLDTWYEGPSILQSRMNGSFESLMVLAHTPIEKGVVRFWHGLMVKLPEGQHTPEMMAAARNYQIMSRDAVAQDVEIWENKTPCLNPMQIPADGPFGKVRIWYSQFYNTRERATSINERVNGCVITVGEERPVGPLKVAS